MAAQGYSGTSAGPRALERQMDMIRDQPAHAHQNTGGIPANSARDIPGYYYSTDTAADTAMSYRASAANGGQLTNAQAQALGLPTTSATGNSGMVQDPAARALLAGMKVDLTPADIEWFEERRRTREQIEFDEWLTTVVDISDPGENRWLQAIYPEFWTRKERYIDDKINIEARLAKIRLRGVKTVDDAKLLFAMEKGYVSPATQPLWSGSPAGGNQFRTGWLSIARKTKTGAPEFNADGIAALGNNRAFRANPIVGGAIPGAPLTR